MAHPYPIPPVTGDCAAPHPQLQAAGPARRLHAIEYQLLCQAFGGRAASVGNCELRQVAGVPGEACPELPARR